MNEMNKETLSPAFADSSMPPGMAERRRLIQLAAGLVVGSTISGLPFVPQAAAQPVGGRRILIAYYSRTGTTREVARQIQKIVGGELFELRTVHRYPDEYRPTTEQAKREQEEGFRPQLTARVDAMETYDTVFVGFPNWWGTMPMAVFSFLEKYNFSAKSIIPFCTHEGSGFGRSMADITRLCPQSTILNGISIRGSSVKIAQQDVSNWLSKIRMIK